MAEWTDEQLVGVLRDAGHEEAATALERKLTARAAVERRELLAKGPSGARELIRRGYEQSGDPAAIRQARQEGRTR